MRKVSLVGGLLATAAFAPMVRAQQAEPPAPSEQPSRERTGTMTETDDEEIIVSGQRPRGSVVGDYQPEQSFNAGDVRALGVSDISELLAELGPQLTSGRGGQPLVLLDGRRVSSFREIATIPTEAIQRVEILPEEVALKYGFPADQKVMNVVLRRRFRAFTLEAQDRFSTDGGANRAVGELGFLTIRRGGRLNLNFEYRDTQSLQERDRNIFTPSGADTQRSLVSAGQQFTVTGTYAKPLSDKINATINGEMSTDQTMALTGPSGAAGLIPDGTPLSLDALGRSASNQSALLGATINADGKAWRSTLTSTFTHDETRTISDGRYDPDSLPVAAALATRNPADVARSISDVATADLTTNGNLYRLPAGEISLTLRLGGSLSDFESRRSNFDQAANASLYREVPLDRSIGLGSLSLDVPLIRSPSPFLGKLSANGNAEVQSVSDFGTVKGYGFGLNWRPRSAVSLIASYKNAETAPTVQQIGNPQILTTNVQVFDYQTGQTVNITQVTGGNPNLRVAEQNDLRLGLTVKPFTSPNMTFTVDYNSRTTKGSVGSLPGTTDAAELAFPDRFVRDADGNLLSIDSRSVNIARRESSSIRWGVNFTKTLKTPQSQIDAMRKAMAARFPNGVPPQFQRGQGGGDGPPGGQGGPSRSTDSEGGGARTMPGGGADGSRPAFGGGTGGAGGGFGGGPGGGGGGFGGRGGPGGGPGGGGRINLAIYHTVNLTDRVTLRDGLPSLDLLGGDTLGERAGQPRHEVELQAGFSQSGYGARLTGQWESATRVVGTAGTPSSNLRFSDIATFNLRLFANLGQRPELVTKMPWLRGARVQFSVNNILNTRQGVTDGNGATPLAYRPGLIDPLGRTVTITLRKQLF